MGRVTAVRIDGATVREPGRPTGVFTPTTASAVGPAVAEAACRGRTVRPVGAGRSLSPILATDGLLVPTDRLVAIHPVHRGLRAGWDPEALVSVEAGVRVGALMRWLHRRGRTLENVAAFTGQTVAGAVATASHGTGLGLPPMCDQVVSLVVVGADGRRRRIEPAGGPTDPRAHEEPDTELIADDDVFYAAVTGLGAFGLAVALTLRTLPTFPLVERRFTRPRERVFDALADGEALRDIRHVQVLFDIGPGGRGLATVTERSVIEKVAWLDALRPRQRILPTVASRLPLAGPVLSLLRARPDLVPTALEGSLGSTNRAPLTGYPYRLLDNWPLNHCAEAFAIEGFVPLDRWREAVDALVALAGAPGVIRPWGPVSLRFVAASQHLLAPSYRRAGAMIEVVHLVGAPGGREALLPYAACLAQFGGRVHFGLDVLGIDGADELAARYPELPRWQRARAALDPAGVFASPYLRRLGLVP